MIRYVYVRLVYWKHTDIRQIACREGLPFSEIQRTPYGVMVTTSWGGHLGWYELGGDRWFVKPVCTA